MWAICAVYAIAYTSYLQKDGAILKYCAKRLCFSVICGHNCVDVRTSLTTLKDAMCKMHHTSSNAHIFVICKDKVFKFSVIVHNR